MTAFIPALYQVEVQRYETVSVNPLGEKVRSWVFAGQFPVCAIYTPSSAEPFEAGNERVIVDLCIIAPSDFPVGAHDRVIVDGRAFESIGLPDDYTRGPWWNPGVKLWNLRLVEDGGS